MNLFSSYPWLRPLLFAMDPEAAHDLTFRALESGRRLGLLPASAPLPGRVVRLAGLEFPNPIGLAAGLDKNAAHLDALGCFGFGFIEVGTVTPMAQPGNPTPRLFRLPEHRALINRFGFNNEGLDAFIANVRRSQWAHAKRGVLGLNIGKNAATPMERADQDYLRGLEAVYPWADYVTVNISSPNTKNLRDLQQEDALHRLLAALKRRQTELAQQHGRPVPIFLKIAPDLSEEQIHALAHSLVSHRVEGVVATNTTVSRQAVAGHAHAAQAGGLSGAPLFQASNHVIRTLRTALGPEYPIIGVGGVMSGDDALAKLQAGANLVQIYTGLIYCGPALVSDAVRATRSA